jgi:hypothetical protein
MEANLAHIPEQTTETDASNPWQLWWIVLSYSELKVHGVIIMSLSTEGSATEGLR